MAIYSEAEALMRQLRPIIDKEIQSHPYIKSSLRVQKAVVIGSPDTKNHTVAVKFLPDLFNENISASVFPYNPALSPNDLTDGKAVFVFYYQSLSNGVVMQNASWTSGGGEDITGDGTTMLTEGREFGKELKDNDYFLDVVDAEQPTFLHSEIRISMGEQIIEDVEEQEEISLSEPHYTGEEIFLTDLQEEQIELTYPQEEIELTSVESAEGISLTYQDEIN